MNLSLSSLGRDSCTRAVAWRLTELEGELIDATRRRARRTSLDLLHYALDTDGEFDRIQARRLRELLCEREVYLRSLPLPVWPGAEHAMLVEIQVELTGNREAVEHLDGLLVAA